MTKSSVVLVDLEDASLHQGESMYKFANTYPTITLTIVEAIQNALDAKAKTIFVGIDEVERTIVVYDNGNGVGRDKFRQALLSIGKGVKKPGSIGRFGLGLISPLNKCEFFVFSSCAVGAKAVHNWTFKAEDILPQQTGMKIPYEQTTLLPSIPAQFAEYAAAQYAAWRTMLQINNITKDKVIGVTDLDELENQVRIKLGTVMRTNGTTVHVVLINGQSIEERDINPLEFTGEPLPVAEFVDESCGRVRIELYRAPRTGGQRKGIITVMQEGDTTQIPWSEFYTQALGLGTLNDANMKAAFDVLRSGYFEGVISAQKIELADPRDRFKRGQPLNALHIAIYL